MGLVNSDLKISSYIDNSIKVFIITYPKKNGSIMMLGKDILHNILTEESIIINVDTSLSFQDTPQVSKSSIDLKSLLQDNDVSFDYRVTEPNPVEGGFLSKFLDINKKPRKREILTFELQQHFDNADIFDALLNMGCQVFAPVNHKDDIARDIFYCNFEDERERYSAFKFVLYINNFLGQAALRTKLLDMEDVQKICKQH